MKLAALLLLLIAFSSCTTGQASQSLGRPVSCFDSDGGKSFSSPGTAVSTYNGNNKQTKTDKCEGKKLIEYYCDGGNFIRSEVITCNCLKGACI